MKVYVAAPFGEYRRVRAAQAAIRERGGSITCDWTKEVERYPDGNAPGDVGKEHALADMQGVLNADAMLLLTGSDHAKGCGCWIELGIALAERRFRHDVSCGRLLVVIAGPQRERTIFSRLADKLVDTDLEGVSYLLPAP